MKMQFELLILITTLSLTIADVINPPKYTQSYVQNQPIKRQFYFVPNQYQISDFFYTQPRYIPIYLNRLQVNNPQDNNPLLKSSQNSKIGTSRRIVKIGGRKIFHPSYIIHRNSVASPSTILQRFKKSVSNQSDSGESNTVQPNSSLNDRTMSRDNEIQNPNNIVIKDKENQTTETKKDPTTTSGTLFDLNPKNLKPALLISPNNQKTHDPTNLQDPNTKSNLSNAIDDNVKEISKFKNLTKEPILRNFLNSRLPTTKPMESNVLTERSKNDEIDPITDSVQMKNFSPIKPLAQQIYPTWPLWPYNYYQDLLNQNLVYPAERYQPGVYTVYYSMDGTNKILIPKTNNNQQWSQQQQICQDDINQIIGIIPSSGYTYWPSSEYNYLSNYMLQYPKLSHYYPLSVYPSSYAPHVHNELL